MSDQPQIINIISTKRSGHHAFIDWLRQGLGREIVFANNSIIGAPHDRVIADFDRTVSRSQSPDLSPILVLNYEGITPLGFDRAAEAQKNIGADIRNVLFLRDPLNLCASLIHRKPIIEFELVMILRQLFAERNWLQLYASAANRQSFRLIFYNLWLSDAAYRKDIADDLSLTTVDRNVSESRYGGGSSFKDLRGAVHDDDTLKLTSRWKHYRQDRRFNALTSHPAMMPPFEQVVAGQIEDSYGRSDFDSERWTHMRQTMEHRQPHRLIDRVIERLSAQQGLFHRVECASSTKKRAIITDASLRIMLGMRI